VQGDPFKGAYVSTIGVDFEIKPIQIDGKTINLQIWVGGKGGGTRGEQRRQVMRRRGEDRAREEEERQAAHSLASLPLSLSPPAGHRRSRAFSHHHHFLLPQCRRLVVGVRCDG
jgi:hypothetical protein